MVLFLLRANKYIYGQLFEDMRKSEFVGRYECPRIIKGGYKLSVCTSSQFGGSILRRVRLNFRINSAILA